METPQLSSRTRRRRQYLRLWQARSNGPDMRSKIQIYRANPRLLFRYQLLRLLMYVCLSLKLITTGPTALLFQADAKNQLPYALLHKRSGLYLLEHFGGAFLAFFCARRFRDFFFSFLSASTSLSSDSLTSSSSLSLSPVSLCACDNDIRYMDFSRIFFSLETAI